MSTLFQFGHIKLGNKRTPVQYGRTKGQKESWSILTCHNPLPFQWFINVLTSNNSHRNICNFVTVLGSFCF